MNLEVTLDLLRERFPVVQNAGAHLIRTESRYKDSTVGIFFFDFSNAVADADFNLGAFLENNVASDFYAHEGSVQWNFYVYFVLASATFQAMDATTVAKVEADRAFARKFVVDFEALHRELLAPSVLESQGAQPIQDLSSKWNAGLAERGLSEVADHDLEYGQVVRSYMKSSLRDSAVKETAHARATLAAGEARHGRHLKILDLGNFRPHPLKRLYEFKRVNLIRGVNGTGKTTLLEAIEFTICGSNRRHQSEQTFHPSGMMVQFAGDQGLTPVKVESAKVYRERDRSWYGGYYLRKNRLCENFGLYSFFNTDAATHLSSQDSGELKEAVDTLLLGSSAKMLEERMQQCANRLEREFINSQSKLDELRVAKQKAESDLDRIRAVKDTRETIALELRTKAADCGWKTMPVDQSLSKLLSLHETVSAAAAGLEQSISRVRWMPGVNLLLLQEEAAKLSAIATEIQVLQVKSDSDAEALDKGRSRLETMAEKESILARLARYHENEEASSLFAANTRAEMQAKLRRLRDISDSIRDIDLKPFEDIAGPIADHIDTLAKDLQVKKQAVDDAKNRLATTQSEFSQLKSVVDQIRGLGLHFCEVAPHAQSCPLCGVIHEDLAAKLRAIPEVTSPVGGLSLELANLQRELTEKQATHTILEKLRGASLKLILADLITGETIKSLVATLRMLPEQISRQQEALRSRDLLEKRLTADGFTATDLMSILESASETLNVSETVLRNKDEALSILAKQKDDAAECRRELRERSQADKENQQQLSRILTNILGDGETNERLFELSRRRSIVADVITIVLELKAALDIADQEEFLSIAARLTSFADGIRRLQEPLRLLEEKDALEVGMVVSLAKLDSDIAEWIGREARAKQGHNDLTDLLRIKEDHLKAMDSAHRDRLVTLFSNIHAPREFSDVRLESKVTLRRTNGSTATINEVSTGQRAALAISIFLTLNDGIKSRAPWLLFDDPIAHVDDMNILSFLDMLRDLSLSGDRQMFFATANPRVADLFKRKFECLGDDYTEFHLKR